jgi:iron complex transport system permease protein
MPVKQEVTEVEELYFRNTARKVKIIFVLLALVVGVALVVTPLGAASLGIGDTLQAIISRLPFFNTECSPNISTIIWDLRLPRVIMASISGMGFALSGAAIQGVSRNPLASPFTLGISSAACFGATLAMMFGASMMGWGKYMVMGSAFLFGLGALFLIYGISQRRGITSETVILCGVCLMYLFLALSSTLSVATGGVGSALLLTGNLTESSWGSVFTTLILLLISAPFLLRYSWDLNAMAFGDEVARSSGVNLKQARVVCMMLATLIVSGIVCFTGVIAFVCLLSPYIARMVMGNDHRFIFLSSGLIGALLLLGTDTLARTVIPPIEIPAGLLTTIIGVPFLLYLALGRRSYEA